MRFKTTLRLFMLACFLAAVIWFLERYAKDSFQGQRPGRSLLDLRSEEITQLSLRQGDFRVECARQGSDWYLQWPLKARADEGAITRILNILESAQKADIITPAQYRERELTLQDYGLLDPRTEIVLGNILVRKRLLIGQDSPLGDLVHVRVEGDDHVFLVSREILKVMPAGLEDLRDRMILHGETARTGRLEIKSSTGGFIQIIRTEGEWIIQQPFLTRADKTKVMQLLDALFAVRVERFVWDPDAAPVEGVPAPEVSPLPAAVDVRTRIRQYGLSPDEAILQVTIWGPGDEVGKGLILGRPTEDRPGQIYAKTRDMDSVYAISNGILPVLSVSVNELRDRRLFPVAGPDIQRMVFQEGDRKLCLEKRPQSGWMIIEPVQWKADHRTVEELVEKMTRLRIESFWDGPHGGLKTIGLDPASLMVQISTERPNLRPEAVESRDRPAAGSRTVWSLLIGRASADKPTVAAKLEDHPAIFEIPKDSLSLFGKRPTNPLVYRDRTMLSVPSDSIRRISLLKNGREETVTRGQTDVWTADRKDMPANAIVNPAAIQDILFHAGNLRATRIEIHNPEDLAVYGLDRQDTVLTLGLSGGEGIRKSLLIGNQTAEKGRFAMVQGQDVVFVLEPALADQLLQDLTVPSAGDPPTKEQKP